MLFLVKGEYIDAGSLMPPEQGMEILEMAVVPSFQMLGQLEQQGKVKGGVHPGERAGAFVIEANSFEELDDIMNSLPFFGLVKWEVKPLVPFGSQAQSLPGYIARVRENLPPQQS